MRPQGHNAVVYRLVGLYIRTIQSVMILRPLRCVAKQQFAVGEADDRLLALLFVRWLVTSFFNLVYVWEVLPCRSVFICVNVRDVKDARGGGKFVERGAFCQISRINGWRSWRKAGNAA